MPAKRDTVMERRLIQQAGVAGALELNPVSEEAWIEVVQKMDAVYADLVHHQVELEHKNAALEEAQQFIGSVSGGDDGRAHRVRPQRAHRAASTPALEQLTGRAEAELIGAAAADAVRRNSAALIERFADKLHGDGARSPITRWRSIDRSGNPTPLAMNCSARYDHKGRARRASC